MARRPHANTGETGCLWPVFFIVRLHWRTIHKKRDSRPRAWTLVSTASSQCFLSGSFSFLSPFTPPPVNLGLSTLSPLGGCTLLGKILLPAAISIGTCLA